MEYSLDQFQQDIKAIRPRPFDTYVLPAFLIYFAMKSKAGMGRWSRRVLFTSGVYMVYRNYSEYQRLYVALKARLDAQGGVV